MLWLQRVSYTSFDPLDRLKKMAMNYKLLESINSDYYLLNENRYHNRQLMDHRLKNAMVTWKEDYHAFDPRDAAKEYLDLLGPDDYDPVYISGVPLYFKFALESIVFGKFRDGTDISVAGIKYENAIFAQPDPVWYAALFFRLNRKYKVFSCEIGLNDTGNDNSSTVFTIMGDGKILFTSHKIKARQKPVSVNVPVNGVDKLFLLTDCGDDGFANDHAVWLNPALQ